MGQLQGSVGAWWYSSVQLSILTTACLTCASSFAICDASCQVARGLMAGSRRSAGHDACNVLLSYGRCMFCAAAVGIGANLWRALASSEYGNVRVRVLAQLLPFQVPMLLFYVRCIA